MHFKFLSRGYMDSMDSRVLIADFSYQYASTFFDWTIMKEKQI